MSNETDASTQEAKAEMRVIALHEDEMEDIGIALSFVREYASADSEREHFGRAYDLWVAIAGVARELGPDASPYLVRNEAIMVNNCKDMFGSGAPVVLRDAGQLTRDETYLTHTGAQLAEWAGSKDGDDDE
ncbi:hypothetical protein LCGC14_1468370 [marine sediment metagenome]|uniref:Uncharacterized protein n=1 Tax=marine sediment metagenome TaxID=412755 RepID=A0A0F9JD36_9ZZZZ